MALGHGDVRGGGVERRADHLAVRQERGQLGIRQCVRRERLEEGSHRCEAAVESDAEAVLPDEIPGEPPVRGGLRMLDRVDHVAVLGVPLGRGAMQLGDGIGLAAPQLEEQEIREQRVVAEPGPLRVDRDDERVRVLQLEERPLRPARAGQAVGERAADPLQDRRAEQELLDPFALALEDLGEQVVRDRPLAAGERGDEPLGVRVTGERHRREPQAGSPPLGPRQEHGGSLGGQLDPRGVEQLPRLLGRQPEVDGTDLGQLAGKAETMESQGGVMAGGQDHVQQPWPPREQELQLRLRIRRDQLMQIVDHEHDGLVERLELRDETPHQPFAVERRRWRELLHEPVAADRGAQPLDDGQPEALGVAFVALHQHPGRSGSEARRIDPRAEQHGLPAAGRRRDERDPRGHSGRQAREQRFSCHDASSTNGDRLLGTAHAAIVARGYPVGNGRERRPSRMSRPRPTRGRSARGRRRSHVGAPEELPPVAPPQHDQEDPPDRDRGEPLGDPEQHHGGGELLGHPRPGHARQDADVGDLGDARRLPA